VKITSNESIEGHAALSICESMLLALYDLKVITQVEAQNVLKDASAAHHQEASTRPVEDDMHKRVATLIDKIIANGNSLPRI
jgi:hypothetical protein